MFIESFDNLPLKLQNRFVSFLDVPIYKRDPNVRFIFSTTKDIKEGLRNEIIDKALYNRLNRNLIKLPPLRERKTDIPLLFDFFLKKFSQEYGQKPKEIDDEVLETFINFRWPGNVKELKSVAERLVATVPFNRITLSDLPSSIKGELTLTRNLFY